MFFFINSQIGWVAGADGIIYKTTNAGQNWSSVSVNGSIDFKSIHFADTQHGWVVGSSGVIARTTDGEVPGHHRFQVHSDV